MKIVHISDHHGQFLKLPAADLYIVTGDMLKDFPWSVYRHPLEYDKTILWAPDLRFGDGKRIPAPKAERIGRLISADRYVKKQTEWAQDNNYRPNFGNPDAPVVCIRGNHDFVDLAPLFKGGPVYEIHEPDQPIEVLGLRIGGMCGVPPITGEWSDETEELDLWGRAQRLPDDIDVLVTHVPPLGILSAGWGSQSLARHIQARFYQNSLRNLRLHCFGHVHEKPGVVKMSADDGHEIVFSNAATTYQEIEI